MAGVEAEGVDELIAGRCGGIQELRVSDKVATPTPAHRQTNTGRDKETQGRRGKQKREAQPQL